MNSITFEFYGRLQALAGQPDMALSVALPLSLKQALESLAAELPAISAQLEHCACAIGDELVPRTTMLEESLSIALLPPVAGG